MPSVNQDAALNTGDHESLAAIRARTGRILAAPTMVELLGQAGLRTAVVSAGSPGSSVIQGDSPRHLMVNVRGVVQPAAAERAMLEPLRPFPCQFDSSGRRATIARWTFCSAKSCRRTMR